LTVDIVGQGSVDPSSGDVVSGSTVVLTATPADGWGFDHWEGDASGSENPLSITVASDTTITAVFTADETPGQPTPTVILAVEVSGQGRVELDPPGDEYLAGTDVLLTAVADDGWRFDRWEDGASGSDNPLTLTIVEDTGIRAVFVENDSGGNGNDNGPSSVALAVTVRGNGRVELDPPGGIYDVGTDVTLTAVPGAGWQFEEWTGDVTDTDNPLELTVTEDAVVTAVFTLTTGGDGGGSGGGTPGGGDGSPPPPARLTLRVTSPGDLSLTNQTTIDVAGTVSDSTASVTVNGVNAAIASDTFVAMSVPLAEGTNLLVATAQRGADTATSNITVTRDTTAPNVAVEFPTEGLVLADTAVTVVGSVNDIVVGTVNQENCSVTVQGAFGTVDAGITNRTFLAQNLPLVPGPNVITVTATDSAGNVGTPVTVTVTQQAIAGQRIVVAGGNNQSGTAGQTLGSPVSVQAVDANGAPLAGRFVTFRVVRNNGSLTPPVGPGTSPSGAPVGEDSVTVQTDADGMATVDWTLGTRAGVGNNRLEMSAIGFAAPALICASGASGDCAMLASTAGEAQVGPIGEPLTRPFEVVAMDAGGNRCADVPVTFTVDIGDGNFDGQSSVTVQTNTDGMAATTLTLGPGAGINNNRVTASFPGLTELPAVFRASGVNAGAASQTTFTGVVLDTENRPVPQATVSIEDTDPPIQTTTDDAGLFTLTQVPTGRQHLFVNGATTSRTGVWPFLQFAIDVVSGVQNTLGMPVFLPELDGSVFDTVGATDVDLSMSSVDGFSVRVFAGSATFPDGSTTGSMGVTQVSSDQVPMPPQGGAAPPWVGTLQPPGVRFDPPAQVTAPNSLGLPPGQIIDMFSFDHDLNLFVGIGTGTVQPDGATIVSDPGSGIRKSGWFFDCPPPPPPNCYCNCDDNNDCTQDTCSGPPDCSCTHTPVSEGTMCDGNNDSVSDGCCMAGSCLPGKEFDAHTPIADTVSIPWVKVDIEASPGERMIFNLRGEDKDRRRPKGSAAWTNFTGAGPYQIRMTTTAKAEFNSRGSGTTVVTFSSLVTGNVDLFIKNDWTGAPIITVTATFRDDAPNPSGCDIGSAKDPDKVVTWTIKKRDVCPMSMATVTGTTNVFRPNPASYGYRMDPDIDPPGRPDYENQTILESFQNVTAFEFTMADLSAAFKTANPTLNTPDRVAVFLWNSSNNGTFVVSNQDRIYDRHGGFGSTAPFTAAGLANGIGYILPQTYSCGGTTVQNYTVTRRLVGNALTIKKTGP